MTRNGTAVPTGLVQSKARCHSWTSRQRSACLLSEITKVCVRLVRWNGLKTTIATNATTLGGDRVQDPLRTSIACTTFSLRDTTTAPTSMASEKMPRYASSEPEM